MDQTQIYFYICFYGITFFLYLAFSFAVIIKLDFNIEWSAVIVIILFIFSLGIKLLGWFVFFFLNNEKQD